MAGFRRIAEVDSCKFELVFRTTPPLHWVRNFFTLLVCSQIFSRANHLDYWIWTIQEICNLVILSISAVFLHGALQSLSCWCLVIFLTHTDTYVRLPLTSTVETVWPGLDVLTENIVGSNSFRAEAIQQILCKDWRVLTLLWRCFSLVWHLLRQPLHYLIFFLVCATLREFCQSITNVTIW